MDEEARRYRESLLAEIRADAVAGGDYLAVRFVDRACQILESAEEIMDYDLCRAHSQSNRGQPIQVDAYSYSPNDGILSFVVCSFSGNDDPDPLMTDDVRRLAMGAFRFIEGSVYGSLASSWDESHPAHLLANETFKLASSDELTKICVYIVSDRPLSPSVTKIPELSLGTKNVHVQVWDISRLARVEASVSGREEIVINFLDEYGQGIPALPVVREGASGYDAYMCVMPGQVLADLYDRFGGRILEQNVRAFLGDSRKVNKGIRETIRVEPAMFFAFNNGLTVTASDLKTLSQGDGHMQIVEARGFQIVNGGQTTASLYWARKAGLDLSRVRVQMKLSRLPADGFEDAVHNIARFANAQNAVSSSDLFAGHPYFKRLEGLSRQEIAPPSASGETPTYWYFERTAGSYKVELRRKSGLAARTWQMLNPKRQVITKTDVARYEMTFNCSPHHVSSGAQKNIAAFGKVIEKLWASSPGSFDSDYYRRLIGRAILVRAVDAAIPKQDWYPGSILRPLVTYTVSLMSWLMKEHRLSLDYSSIWKRQQAPDAFLGEAMAVARRVLPLLQEIPEEQVRNRLVTEWVKREACWDRVRECGYQLSERFVSSLVSDEPLKDRKREDWRTQAISLWESGTWRRLRDWNATSRVLTENEADVVGWAAIASEFRPRGFKLSKLKDAWESAVRNGFV